MLQNNDENKLIDKLILATLLALLISLLSALYISKIDTTDMILEETLVSGSQHTNVSSFEVPVKQDN